MSTAGSHTEYTEDWLAEGEFIITDYTEKQLFSVFIKVFFTTARQEANFESWWQKIQNAKQEMALLYASHVSLFKHI